MIKNNRLRFFWHCYVEHYFIYELDIFIYELDLVLVQLILKRNILGLYYKEFDS